MWLWELEERPHTVLEIVQYFQKQYKNSSPVQSYIVISHTTLVGTPEQTNAQASEAHNSYESKVRVSTY